MKEEKKEKKGRKNDKNLPQDKPLRRMKRMNGPMGKII